MNNTIIKRLKNQILNDERISAEDGLRLFESGDINAIGYLANLRREKINGNRAYFVRNQYINYSNICALDCKFCSFNRKEDDDSAYTLSVAHIAKKVREQLHLPITEIHIVGGLHPTAPYEYYLEMLQSIKKLRPDVNIKFLTAVEIDHIAQKFGKTIETVFSDFKNAGISAMPGGGAEVFSKRMRMKMCPEKISGKRWLEIVKTAHRMKIPTNATMLYGTIETYEERIEHLCALREAQDETGGFLAFIPLAYQPQNPSPKANWTTGMDDLKMQAISRIMLDNIPHIKAFWIYLTPSVAQVALNFGADDIDGTVIEENVAHEAGAQTKSAMTKNELVKLIKSAGRTPVERDTFYNVIETFEK